MSNLDIIREKLDGGQFTDLEDLASGLLGALEAIETACQLSDKADVGQEEYKYLHIDAVRRKVSYWTDEFAELPQTCAYETYAATLETPAEGCEEDAVEGSEYCKEHGE